MQIQFLPSNVYKLSNYAYNQSAIDEAIAQKRKILGDWECLKRRGVPGRKIAKETGKSLRRLVRLIGGGYLLEANWWSRPTRLI